MPPDENEGFGGRLGNGQGWHQDVDDGGLSEGSGMRYVSSFVVVAELLQVGRRQGRFDGMFLLGIAHRRRH